MGNIQSPSRYPDTHPIKEWTLNLIMGQTENRVSVGISEQDERNAQAIWFIERLIFCDMNYVQHHFSAVFCTLASFISLSDSKCSIPNEFPFVRYAQ